jgi:release factor glutamine methyltransferase
MRVAGNNISDISNHYRRELHDLYPVTEIDAVLRLAAEHYLGVDSQQLLKEDLRLSESELLKLYDCCKELKSGRPLQYILGTTWFYGLQLSVNPSVLIPRPETEELVHTLLKQNQHASEFLDMCTGSGCIALAISANIEGARVDACDISEPALAVAKKNAVALGLKVNFFREDVLNYTGPDQKYDVIVSNPPYVLESERESLSPQVAEHEPSIALFPAGEDPLIFYRRIIGLCATHLKPGGNLYFELNPLTAENVLRLANSENLFGTCELLTDLSGKKRFLRASMKG